MTNSPVLMSCISERLGFGTLMELAQRVPTEDEVDQLVSCFERAGADSASGAAEAPAKNPLWC